MLGLCVVIVLFYQQKRFYSANSLAILQPQCLLVLVDLRACVIPVKLNNTSDYRANGLLRSRSAIGVMLSSVCLSVCM